MERGLDINAKLEPNKKKIICHKCPLNQLSVPLMFRQGLRRVRRVEVTKIHLAICCYPKKDLAKLCLVATNGTFPFTLSLKVCPIC